MLLSPQQLFAPRPSTPAVRIGLVGQLVQGPAPAAPADRVQLRPTPTAAAAPATLPGISLGNAPRQQLTALGQKYGVPFNGNWNTFQKDIIHAIITHKAREHGVPIDIAKGIAGNESNWKMWTDLDKGTVIQGKNIRDGELKSTDWGVMQINDKAHARAFPRAKNDLEYNIEYGIQFLARQRQSIQGSLGLGLGDWDRTVASYNLGHNPRTEKSLQIATRYVSKVQDKVETLQA
jgi:hypothetical protein